jgi:hypothetical protein
MKSPDAQKNKSGKTILLLALVLLSGCQSLQRDLLYSSGGDEEGMAELAELIVPLDKNPGRNALAAARKRVGELEKSSVKDRNFEGRLAAWSGRLFLLEGRPRNAEAQLKKAEGLYPGSIEGRVLAIRLEADPEKRLELCEASLTEARGGGFLGRMGEFNIELGRTRLELKNYREAAAAFDSAFPQLAAVYRGTYDEDRNLAWQLRNLDPGANPQTAAISQKSVINWEDAIELSRTETELLRFISAGRNMSAAELFRLLSGRAVIPPVQNILETDPAASPKTTPQDALLRAGAAWYLWHLLAENRADRSILVRYSSRYSERSPLPDLPRSSIFFDAVLGCIEREFMTLPDGKNFNGNGTVGGAEFLGMLKKVR